jgi:hypothetical protein
MVACFAIGLLPRAAGSLSHLAASALLGPSEAPLESGLADLAPAALLLAGAIVAAVAVGFLVSSRGVATITWDCGYALPTARMQYTASSFAQVLSRLFRRVLFADMHRPALRSPFPGGARFESHVPDPVLDRLILPATDRGRLGFGFVRAIQTGHIQSYLVYIVVTLVALLAWSSAW